ncbi:metallopeptidase family protein [Pontivivens nitratireducens]|uniref:Metallopeptidase family protein n=1 Tax=Pontivivens nitratireducens TaxID=2758038 RepID=A0A6G7VJB8_9RHOB|nr:metallopeptidase family protein [Pontibrevibacter nitratireducens]QIK40032.1 metallopeptidase family protein [Pontibrevibacter nitratireducens]
MEQIDILPPGLPEIAAMAQAVREALPEDMRRMCADLVVRVEDFADDETLEEMGIASPYELTGLYSGIPLTEKSVADQGYGPDTVYLYRRAILEEWIERGDVGLEHLVGHVLIHEIAHHFGWSDAQLHAIEDWTL